MDIMMQAFRIQEISIESPDASSDNESGCRTVYAREGIYLKIISPKNYVIPGPPAFRNFLKGSGS